MPPEGLDLSVWISSAERKAADAEDSKAKSATYDPVSFEPNDFAEGTAHDSDDEDILDQLRRKRGGKKKRDSNAWDGAFIPTTQAAPAASPTSMGSDPRGRKSSITSPWILGSSPAPAPAPSRTLGAVAHTMGQPSPAVAPQADPYESIPMAKLTAKDLQAADASIFGDGDKPAKKKGSKKKAAAAQAEEEEDLPPARRFTVKTDEDVPEGAGADASETRDQRSKTRGDELSEQLAAIDLSKPLGEDEVMPTL